MVTQGTCKEEGSESYTPTKQQRASRRLWIALPVVLMVAGCREQILHNLSESEANHLVTVLSDKHLEVKKVVQPDGTWALSVDDAQAVEALRFLNEARLLRRVESSPLDKASVVSSREDQRFRYERALSREIEATLNNVPGVLESRVHLNLPLVDPLFGQRLGTGEGSASVLLVVEDTFPEDQGLGQLVSGASGIPLERVSVLIRSSTGSQMGSALPEGELGAEALSNSEGSRVSQMTEVSPASRSLWSLSLTNTTLQVGVSLLILGFGILVMLLRYRRRSEEIPYDVG